MVNRSKQRGTAAESAVVACLQANGFPAAERRALAGANDKGDVGGISNTVIEVKDCARQELAAWLDEAAQEAVNARARIYAVWHKRKKKGDPKRWYVTTDGEVFLRLLEAATEKGTA